MPERLFVYSMCRKLRPQGRFNASGSPRKGFLQVSEGYSRYYSTAEKIGDKTKMVLGEGIGLLGSFRSFVKTDPGQEDHRHWRLHLLPPKLVVDSHLRCPF